MTDEELRHRFTYHPPTGDKVQRHQQVREAGRALAELVDGITYDCREKSLALTHVEEVVMWANAAIARERDA